MHTLRVPPHDSRKTGLRNANFTKWERHACLHEKKVTISQKNHTTSHKRTWPQIVHPVKRQLKVTPVLNRTSPDASCSQHHVLLVKLCHENVHDLFTHLSDFLCCNIKLLDTVSVIVEWTTNSTMCLSIRCCTHSRGTNQTTTISSAICGTPKFARRSTALVWNKPHHLDGLPCVFFSSDTVPLSVVVGLRVCSRFVQAALDLLMSRFVWCVE